MTSVRVATWNVERPTPRRYATNRRKRRRLEQTDADVWVLTETHPCLSPGDAYTGAFSAPMLAARFAEGEAKVAVWSRWPITRRLPTANARYAMCVEVATPAGPLVVFGVVLPYAHTDVRAGAADAWQRHYEAIEQHADTWRALAADSDRPLCVAGDFNQTRDGRGRYGTARGRALLSEALAGADLVCVTETDVVAQGRLASSLVDHVALPERLAAHARLDTLWGKHTPDGKPLSDHNGVCVAVDLS